MKERLTTDNPITNTGTMLNLAYAKDGNVYLRCGVDDINLCDYVSDLAIKKGCNNTSKEIMEGACLECECEVNLLYCLGVQAAELRERLKYYEDSEETRQLIIPPCKVGDVVYFAKEDYHDSAIIDGIHITEQGVLFTWVQYEVGCELTEVWDEGEFYIDEIGKTVFLTREEAEAKLKEGVQK